MATLTPIPRVFGGTLFIAIVPTPPPINATLYARKGNVTLEARAGSATLEARKGNVTLTGRST